MQNTRKSGATSHLFPLVRRKFHHVLSQYQSTSGSVPSTQHYQLMQVSIEFSSSTTIFEPSAENVETSVERFLMNDVLRWTVIHVSQTNSKSTKGVISNIASRDFALMRACLEAIPSAHKQHMLWVAILRELIASACDILILTRGLQELCTSLPENEKNDLSLILKCEAMDKLAVNVVADALHSSISSDYPKTDLSSLKDFMKTCVGIHAHQNGMLVKKKVVSQWVKLVSSAVEYPAVGSILSVLMELVDKGLVLSPDETDELFVVTWLVGGDIWIKANSMLASTSDQTREQFSGRASTILKTSLLVLCDDASQLTEVEIENRCGQWSAQATRLFSTIEVGSLFEAIVNIGLTDSERWGLAARGNSSLTKVLYKCTSDIISSLNCGERVSLFGEIQKGNHMRWFVDILVSVSGPDSVSGVASAGGSGSLVSLFGGQDVFEEPIVIQCMESLIGDLQESLKRDGVHWRHKCLFAIKDFLCQVFQPFLVTDGVMNDEHVVGSELKLGDPVWYVTNPEQGILLQEAKVAKVHLDDFPRLYFTIQFEVDGKVIEKQTVAERLRGSGTRCLTEEEISSEDKLFRSKISCRLMDKIIRPFWETKEAAVAEIVAGCVNVVVSQCGIFGKAGLGSLRYDLFQSLSLIQNQIVHFLEAGDCQSARTSLRFLSLALGFGTVSSNSSNTLAFLHFDPQASLHALVKFYEGAALVEELDKATLMWITTAFAAIDSETLLHDLGKMVVLIVMRVSCVEKDDALLAMKSMINVYKIPSLSKIEHRMDAISKIIGAFADAWECEDDFDLRGPKNSSVKSWWTDPLESLVLFARSKDFNELRVACRLQGPSLICGLHIQRKRWFAFRFLFMASFKSDPLRVDKCEDMLSTDTRNRLKHWKKDMIVEDCEELEDDILTVFEWVPTELMTEIESWIDDNSYFDSAPEDTTVARMLAWLAFLQYMDSAAASDSRNRAAFSSYASKTEGVFFVLSACVMHLDLNLDRKLPSFVTTTDNILTDAHFMNVYDLSVATMFHTIEAFPTLSRGWWEEDCPKALSSSISKFVQLSVAPETLRRELKRINEAENLGDMTVRGSMVSREVTATYVQDECTLSLSIQIPSNFPLRSVEVDGRKTLGIPESRFKRWALQIRQILSNQDGTLLDALLLWKRNVEKEFEGVEPCPVCYSVLAVKTHELPNLECKTCANRFHSSCLHKWFASSGKSQCVLCQQPWNGARIT